MEDPNIKENEPQEVIIHEVDLDVVDFMCEDTSGSEE